MLWLSHSKFQTRASMQSFMVKEKLLEKNLHLWLISNGMKPFLFSILATVELERFNL